MFEELPEIQDSQDIEDQRQRGKPILREIVETVLLTVLIFCDPHFNPELPH